MGTQEMRGTYSHFRPTQIIDHHRYLESINYRIILISIDVARTEGAIQEQYRSLPPLGKVHFPLHVPDQNAVFVTERIQIFYRLTCPLS